MMKQRVFLRAFEPEDYKTIFRWRCDEEINSMLGGTKYFFSEENEKNWVINAIKDTSNIKLAISLLHFPSFIALMNKDERSGK